MHCFWYFLLHSLRRPTTMVKVFHFFHLSLGTLRLPRSPSSCLSKVYVCIGLCTIWWFQMALPTLYWLESEISWIWTKTLATGKESLDVAKNSGYKSGTTLDPDFGGTCIDVTVGRSPEAKGGTRGSHSGTFRIEFRLGQSQRRNQPGPFPLQQRNSEFFYFFTSQNIL